MGSSAARSMTTAIDIIALWNDDTLNTLARSALDSALGRSLVIAAPVFAELLAAPRGMNLSLIPSAKTLESQWTGT
jgi:hypothetical protein